MALTTGGFFLVSGSLVLLVATQMPDGPGDRFIVHGIVIAAVLIGIGMLAWGHQLRSVHHHALVAGGTVMLTIAIYESTSPVAAVALASLYISAAIDACAFFTRTLQPTTCCLR
jgi:hypothetical protein